MTNRELLILAVLLLLLPLLYVGSYLAVVFPCDDAHDCYRLNAARLVYVYWPLEQLDRRLRPRDWQRIRVVLDDFDENATPRNDLLLTNGR